MAIDYNILLRTGPNPIAVAQNQLLSGLQLQQGLQQAQREQQLAPLRQQLLEQQVQQGVAQAGALDRQNRMQASLYGMQRMRDIDSPEERFRQALDIDNEVKGLYGVSMFDDDGPNISEMSDQFLDRGIQRIRGMQGEGLSEFQRRNLATQERRLDLEEQRVAQADIRESRQQEALDAQLNEAVQEALARSKQRGSGIGKAEAQQISTAPKSISQSNSTIALIDDILAHPGLKGATGFEGAINPANFIPGTDEYDFALKLEQLQGKAFLQAFETLKGGGQITQIEGDKATAAIEQLSRKQSTQQFIDSLNGLRSTAIKGRTNAQNVMRKFDLIEDGIEDARQIQSPEEIQTRQERPQGQEIAPGIKFLGFE